MQHNNSIMQQLLLLLRSILRHARFGARKGSLNRLKAPLSRIALAQLRGAMKPSSPWAESKESRDEAKR